MVHPPPRDTPPKKTGTEGARFDTTYRFAGSEVMYYTDRDDLRIGPG